MLGVSANFKTRSSRQVASYLPVKQQSGRSLPRLRTLSFVWDTAGDIALHPRHVLVWH